MSPVVTPGRQGGFPPGAFPAAAAPGVEVVAVRRCGRQHHRPCDRPRIPPARAPVTQPCRPPSRRAGHRVPEGARRPPWWDHRRAGHREGPHETRYGDATEPAWGALGSLQADSRARPLARRAARIARPARVRILSRKPWVLARRRLLGWKVRLVTGRLLDDMGSSTVRAGAAQRQTAPLADVPGGFVSGRDGHPRALKQLWTAG